MLKETLTLLSPELEERHAKINLDLAENTPLLQLDTNQIQQALYNLIKNAFQALPASGGQIDITSRATDYEVTLTIRDHGSGIPPEVMGTIFEPYRSTKEAGSGLGLLIVRRIIREHGGTIEIDSDAESANQGTSVMISIPTDNNRLRWLEDNDAPFIEVGNIK